MKLPRSLLISGRRWKVVRGDPGEGDVGSCDYANRTITLDPRLEGNDLESTAIHEILHACLPEAQIVVSERVEELLVELLSQRVGGVLKQLWGVRGRK